jgi:hypothetical protein
MVKISDFRAEQYPIVEGLRCVNVYVPDDDAFMPLLAGLLYLPTRMFNYTGDTDTKRGQLAQMWVDAYGANEWMDCMDCEQVAECIASNEATREALNQWFIDALNEPNSGIYKALRNGGLMSDDDANKNLTGENETCDLDALWGFIDGGIDGMNTNNIDAQQIVEEKSNLFERYALLVGAIPGVGELPVDEVLSYFQGLWSDDLFEAYEANDTTEYRNTLKCEIFCLAQDNDCNVTIDLLYDYFKGRVLYSGEDTLDDVIAYLISGVWEGTQVNDVFYLMQILWLKYGNRFFPVLGLMGISTQFALGEPSDDWMLLCEDCADLQASSVGLFDLCGTGAIQTVDFEEGIPFDLDAIEFGSFPGSYYLAVILPAGDWQVTQNAFTGTVTPPADLNQDAYSWQGTDAARHDVTWLMAEPDEFGTQDTRQGSFAAFCDGQNWNLVIFNEAPFTCTFTVTAL